VNSAAAGLLLALSVVGSGCGSAPTWNLVIVTFDTTRADHIGAYGHAGASTPNIDRLAADGVLFRQAFTAVPITLPSHTTIMTGRYPVGHGVRDNGIFTVPEEELTLAEILRGEGYRTAAAVGSFPLTAQFGLDQGFELFDDRVSPGFEDFLARRRLPRSGLFFDERRAARVNEAIYPWLDEHHREPFFLWVHYFDPHQPQAPPPPYNQLFAGRSYDGEIAYADESLGTLLGRLEELGVDERTLVVFTADHGEGLGEHHEDTHSILAYNTTLHVPLVMRIPGGPAARAVAERVGTVDIVPTVLELLGLPVPDDLHGRSLAPLLDFGGGEAEPSRPYYAETLSPRLLNGWGELRGIFSGRFKYIHGPEPELFDLTEDPDEIHNLMDDRPEVVEALHQELEAFMTRHASRRGQARREIDEETLRRLESLGYLHAAGDTSEIREVLRDDGIPPQQRVGDVNEMSLTKNHLAKGESLAAREGALNLLKRDPANPFYLELLAQAELQLGRPEAALAALEQISGDLDGRQSLPGTLAQMGFVLFVSGERERGIEMVERGQAITPNAEGQFLLAGMYSEQEADSQRNAAFERTLEIDPSYAPARIQRAILIDGRGDPERAEREFRQALKDRPYYPAAHYNYGAFLVSHGRPESALDRFRRAVDINPDYLTARYAVIATLHGLQRLDDARRSLAELEELAPASEEAAMARRLIEAGP
jgi:arylsulfatase A-like enzyme